MTRREPTVHKKELMVACPECGSVRGAACYTDRGHRMKGVHQVRAELYREQYPA
ncbi:hypothetical protein STHAL_18275 [Streptomyces halstedii]|uniref:DNA-binding phage zinc finger domain-containing protein n=1 Tax=Streptomyces halstedii TaxID=1944 RepID=A0ABS6TTG4_STRHA|nr:hypothetical protein [Streptomyces halstedii]MBV7671399.1 hypothetical protein [Streptomyces halstedii]